MMLHAHLLHIPLEPDPLLVTAGDPFVATVDPKWLPQRSLRTLTAAVEALLEKTEKQNNGVAEIEEKEMKLKEDERTEESEEQRRICQQWLSEWAGD